MKSFLAWTYLKLDSETIMRAYDQRAGK